ncbi:uncharacterized protein LOC115448723 isoform X2 [Manduca sexta]|nr:uncharacterized protein LOC115448723 isoform X2 [Manduca sexta]
MMSSIALESEDLDYVPVQVVRMEDVQPREIRVEVLDSSDDNNLINDDDSNIGSMVSIHSEEIVEEICDEVEVIVPQSEPLVELPIEIEEKKEIHTNPPDSWPTLEILPGGVIKHADKNEDDFTSKMTPNTVESGEMMYACAKCSQSFKYLFCLVKHVRWHEEEEKKNKTLNSSKLSSPSNDDYVCLHSGGKRIIISKTNKKKVPKRLKS